MPIQSLPRSVKTLQHPKALANARQVVRGTYHLIYSDRLNEDAIIDTLYGPERNQVGFPNSLIGDSTNVVGAGRIEPVPEEMKVLDSRIAEKEVYRLFWLPYNYGGNNLSEAWFDGNQAITVPLIASGSRIEMVPGMRVWINLTGSPDMLEPVDGGDNRWALDAFIVVENSQPNLGDILEFQALIVKDKTQPGRFISVP